MNALAATLSLILVSCIAQASERFSHNAEKSLAVSAFPSAMVSSLQTAFQRKCVWPEHVPQSCFLAEMDVLPKGRADRILLFRGESGLKGLPNTASFYRWATGDKGICRNCTEPDLTTYLLKASQPLTQGLSLPIYFRVQDLSWRDESGRLAKANKTKKMGVAEFLAVRHKVGAGIYFEDNKKQLFDVMVSFSADPFVADLFASLKQNSQGVLWVASVPKSALKMVSKKECATQTLEVGKIYDFNVCIDDAISQQESEVNAYLYLPNEFLLGKILNR